MCSSCDDTGLTFAATRGDDVPPIAICPHRDCVQGQRIAKVLMAIAQGEPIALLHNPHFIEPISPSVIIAPATVTRRG